MGKKKDEAFAHVYIEVTPGFDEADAAVEAFAQKIQVRITAASTDGIAEGLRRALPTTKPTVWRDLTDTSRGIR